MTNYCIRARALPSVQASYTTNFPATENPISEGGLWVRGATEGLDWHDPRTTTNLCFGTQPLGVSGTTDDSIAHLKNFGPNQSSQVTFANPGFTGEHEIEMLLRFAITAHNARGYEITVIDTNDVYVVVWNGALGNFTILQGPISAGVIITNGAVWYSEIVGTVITVKCNGATITTYDTAGDAVKWSNGNPGIGFYTDTTGGAQTGNNTYCISSFTATTI